MALNFEGPIAFDADAVPVNYFDQDMDGDDVFFQSSPRATQNEEETHETQFHLLRPSLPQEAGNEIALQDASLFSPIPSSTREALDLSSPNPAPFYFPADSDDSEFSDLGRHALETTNASTEVHENFARLSLPVAASSSSAGTSLFSSASNTPEQQVPQASFKPSAPHPAVCFGAGGKLVVWFTQSTHSATLSLKHILQESKNGSGNDELQLLPTLPGPLLNITQNSDQVIQAACMASSSSSLSSERMIARDLLSHTLIALYQAHEKSFEQTVVQHLMSSLALTVPSAISGTNSSDSVHSKDRECLSPRGEISNLFGAIDAVFKVDNLLELERLLLAGDLAGSQNLALKLHSSSHALVLSLLPQPPPASYAAIIQFALSLPAGPMRSLYLRIARYQGQLFDDFRWREHLLFALCFPAERAALTQLAYHLETSLPEAADICQLIIGGPPLSQLRSRIQPHRPLLCPRRIANLEKLRLCELFECIHYRHLHAPVPEFHADLQLLKFVLAGMLNDYGFCHEASAYVFSILQQGGLSPEFFELLQWTSLQLQSILSPITSSPQVHYSVDTQTSKADLLPQAPVQAQMSLQQDFLQHPYSSQQSSYSLRRQTSGDSQLDDLSHSSLRRHTSGEPQNSGLAHDPLRRHFSNEPQISNPMHSCQSQQSQASFPQNNFAQQLHTYPQPPAFFAHQPHLSSAHEPTDSVLSAAHIQSRYPPASALSTESNVQQSAPHFSNPSLQLPTQVLGKPDEHSDSSSKKSSSGGSGWFSGIKKLLAVVPEAREANLEQDHSFYYDEKLGRYVGTWKEEAPSPPKPQEAPLPPPPPPNPKLLLNGSKPTVRYALDASALSFTQ